MSEGYMHHRMEGDRLLTKATELADAGKYPEAQTVLELSEAHFNRAVTLAVPNDLRGLSE